MLIEYLEQAVKYKYSVAPFERSMDSQTQWVISKLAEQSGGPLKVLDYGCGNLRLLHAIKDHDMLRKQIAFFATDRTRPNIHIYDNTEYTYIELNDITKMPLRYFDYIIITNVIHEVSIRDFAQIIENTRRLLKNTGKLLLLDMAILAEGEYRALPYYPWELQCLFITSIDYSYASRGNVPVVALEVPRSGIPIYQHFQALLIQLITEKRDYYCQVACNLSSRESNPKINDILARFSLGRSDAHDLGYLMLMSGFANYKLIELSNVPKLSEDEICDAAEAILKLYFSYWAEKNKLPTYFIVFDILGQNISYEALAGAMQRMTGKTYTFFMPSLSDNIGEWELEPSEVLDVFEDSYEYSDIRKMGLIYLQYECQRKLCLDG